MMDRSDITGIWAFDMMNVVKPTFITDPIHVAASNLCADHPRVIGISPRLTWSKLQPEEDRFDWAYTDRVFEIAEMHEKQVFLAVIGGANIKMSPDWLRAKVGHCFMRESGNAWGDVTWIPYLNDPTFQLYWNNLIRAVGDRYRDHHCLRMVRMSSGIGQELYYIKNMSAEEFAVFAPRGFDICQDAFQNSWAMTMRAYRDAFPYQFLTLDLAEPFKLPGINNLPIYSAVVNRAQALFGSRLCVQQDGLSERDMPASTVTYPMRRFMLDDCQANVLGFQTLVPPPWETKIAAPEFARFTDLRKTIDVGLTFPIRYLELFVDTLKNPANDEHVAYLQNQLFLRV